MAANWDFDCPQYVDFMAPVDDCDTDFFDNNREEEKKEEKNTRRLLSSAAPPNVIKSLDDWRSKTTDIKTEPQDTSKPKPTVTRPAVHSSEQTKSLKRSSSVSNVAADQRTLKKSYSSTQVSQPKRIQRANSFSQLHQSQRAQSQTLSSLRRRTPSRSPRTRSRSSSIGTKPVRNRTSSTGRKRLLPTASDDDPNISRDKPSKMPKLAMTPTFMRKQKYTSTSQKVQTTEEIQMEQIAMMRKEMNDKRKKNEQSYKKALAPKSSEPVMSSKCTKVEEFHFQTDSRVKTHEMKTRGDGKGFEHSLRSNTQSQKPMPAGGITVVQPFNLTETKIRSEDKQSSEKFLSMAEKVKAFHRQTPDRFRSKTKTGPLTRAHSKSPPRLRCTIPKTPSFETRSRARPISTMTRQELEERELEEIKINQFRAHPFNQKIFSHPELGLKKVESKPVTQTEEFSLTSDRRVKMNSAGNNSTQEDKYEFRARPVPVKILERVVGVKRAARVAPTLPKSPAFALKHRAHLPRTHKEVEEEDHVIKRNPVPHTGIPFQPKLAHKQVVVEPFSFEGRDKERRAKKEEKIKQIKEDESKVPDFRANDMPGSVVCGDIFLPVKAPKAATVPQPFDLELDKRGKRRLEEFQQKVDEERQHEKEMTVFKAQDATVITKEPFIPKKSDKPFVDITAFNLNTERRANEREAFEQKKKHREAEISAFVHEEERRKKEEEQEAVNRIRQEMVHRANPVRHYKAVEIYPSNKPMTTPLTPQLCTSRVRRFRSSNQDVSS